MTDKLAPSLPTVLRQLVMKWRDQSAGKHVSGDDYYDGQRCGFARAAKELEAVIEKFRRHPLPEATALEKSQ